MLLQAINYTWEVMLQGPTEAVVGEGKHQQSPDYTDVIVYWYYYCGVKIKDLGVLCLDVIRMLKVKEV